MYIHIPIPLFPLGRVVATPGALDLLDQEAQNATQLLVRHQCGDWGDVCRDDALANDQAIANACACCRAIKSASKSSGSSPKRIAAQRRCCCRPITEVRDG